MRDRARTVVVGAGIVGVSAGLHLAELGETDVLVLDRGRPLDTGGATARSPGLVFQTSDSRSMCRIARDSVRLYGSLELDGEPCWLGVGSVEVATTPERMRELRRRLGLGRSFGLEGGELVGPREVAARIPPVDPERILSGYLVPGDGIARAVPIVTALTRRARERGVELRGGVTVTGLDARDGRVRGVETDLGRIECERVLICAGAGGPAVGAMAGVPVPLVALPRRLVRTDPVPGLEGETREAVHPILRHPEAAMCFRQMRDRYVVDAPCPDDLDATAAEAEAARLLPALERRMPSGDPGRVVELMLPFTPDAAPIVGESSRVRGVWVCEAVGVELAGGMGRQVAEWITAGEPSYDLAEADANRFYPYETTPPYVLALGRQHRRQAYAAGHPRRQVPSPRKLRLSPFYARHVELGAELVVRAGWERPRWFGANAPLVPREAPWLRRDEWSGRFWSPIEGAEHLSTRSGAALFDITPLAKLDVAGPDACAFLERIGSSLVDRPVGTIVPTPLLTPRGGIRCHVTVARKAEDLFRLVTGAEGGQRDLAWLRAQARDGERVTVTERTGGLFALGLWGPRARDILRAVTDGDVSEDAFPNLTARYINVGEVGPVWAQRISCVGEQGWELYGQIAMGDRAWELLWEAGEEHGLVAAGLGALDSLRLESGRRAWGRELDAEHDPLEAGLGAAVHWDKDFQGRDALERIRDDGGPARALACLTLDDPRAVALGKEPILHEGRVVSYATSACYGYSIGRCIAYGYLPRDLTARGTAVEIEYLGERVPATVAADPPLRAGRGREEPRGISDRIEPAAAPEEGAVGPRRDEGGP
jgi:glycine cleavage system aminomethyltransferase T/glycine/D-amino acid oxidase-like deaminating enzyme